MAITDKVIELSPVNKKKNIIFYVIMGVLLATTVLFLLLFILKPAASAGEISGLELTSNLYKDGDAFIAAKGDAEKEYTVCAVVGYSGDDTLDTSLEWILPAQFTRTNANEITESDMQEARRDATLSPDENTKVVYDYCKFKIDTGALSDNKATITVRTNAKNKEDAAFQTKTIDIIVRDVGAREIDFTRVTTQTNTPPAALTQGDEEGIDAVLRLPYISRPTATSYTVYLEQLPEVDSTGREMPITVRLTNELSSGGNRYSTNAILAEVVGEQTAINLITPDSTASNAFTFGVSSTGTAIVKVTGNKYNSSAEITKTLKIIVNPIDAFDVVTGYKLMENAVDSNAESAPAGSGIDEIELLAGTGTGRNVYDLQSHIAVTPWRLQKSWAGRNVSVVCTDEKGQALPNNTIVRTSTNGQGITLEPLSPGVAYVNVTDTSANSIGTTLKFKVNVRYDVTSFGYGDRTTTGTHSVNVITGSERNELEVTYVLTGKTADVKPDEINARLKVSGGSGIAFHNILKGTTDVIEATPRFVERMSNGNVIMKATLYFDVESDIGEDSVSFTLTPIGSTSDSKLTVTVKARVQATRIEFISEDQWNELKEQHLDSDELLGYASYSVDAGGNATLSLNMSNNPGYYTEFALGDLVKFFDAGGNDASLSGRENVRVTTSDNYSQTFTLSDDNPSPLSKIHPTYVQGDNYDNFNTASLTFSLGETSRRLTIITADTPQKLSYTGFSSSFTYGCPAKDSSALRSISVLPEKVTQEYASGALRSPSKYYVSIHVNTMTNELIQVDPLKFVDKNIVTDELIPYVYYVATQDAATALETKARSITDKASADSFRQEARRASMFAVKRSYNGSPKDVHLLQDLYTTDYSSVGWEGGSKINQIRIRLYPCDDVGTPDLRYAADDYALTPVRLIDEIVLTANGISGGDGSFVTQASSGSRLTVKVGAKLYIGTADQSSTTESKVYEYSATDVNLETLQRPVYDEGDMTVDSDGYTFTMPVVQSGVENERNVTIAFAGAQSTARTALAVTVHNRTLPVSNIKLYSDAERTTEIGDGAYLLLNTLLAPVDYNKIYYEITYDGTHLGDFISYENVTFKYSSANLFVDYDDIFPNGNAIANNGGKTEFTGSITLHGIKTGTSEFYMQPSVSEASSNKIRMLVYTPSSGIKMTDNSNDKIVFSSGDGKVDSVTMNIATANGKPQKQWTLKRFFEKENENIEAGGTSYSVSVKVKKSDTDSKELSSADGLEWTYDTGSQTLTLTSTGKGIASPLSLEVVITEYAADGDRYSYELKTHTIEFTVAVTVSVYSTELTIDPDETGDNRPAFVTNGDKDSTVEKKLGAILNGGKDEHAPTVNAVEYKLYKNGTDISGDTTHAFRLEKKADGFTYVVADNSVLSLNGDTYTVSAVSGGVESAKVTLSLTTTAEHIAFTKSANVEDNGTYTSHDKTDTYNLSAQVLNSGTNAHTKNVTYNVFDMSGSPFATGKAPASVDDNSGILSFNDVGSAEFKVVISCESLPTLTVNFVYENAVTQIKTVFDGHTSTSGDLTLTPVLFDGGAKTLNISAVELLGTFGTPYTGAAYEVVWTQNDGVCTYDADTKIITYNKVGKAKFTLKAETYPNSGEYKERTFTLEAKAPTFTATFASSDTASVNIMDVSGNQNFDLTLSSSSVTDPNIVITSVLLDGTTQLKTPSLDREGASPQSASRERVDGRVENLFSLVGNKIVLNYAAFASANLSSVQTYEFTVSATVNGVNAANTVKLYIRVSADKTYSSPQFSVYEFVGTDIGNTAEIEDENNWQEVTGNTLKLKNSGKYTVLWNSALESSGVKVYCNGTLMNESNPVISFTNVGTVVISATYTKYQKTFDIGTRTYFVTNDGSVVTGTLNMFESVGGKYYIDYSTVKKTITYTIDWSGAGRDFASGDFTIHYNSDILSVSDTEYNTGSKTAKWTFTVNKPGTTTIFASAAKDGAYYASTEQSATFDVSARPTADNFTIDADHMSLDPTAPTDPVILSGASNASAVEESQAKSSATITPTFNKPANFVGDYTVSYAIVSGNDYVDLGKLGANNTMPVTAKWTYGGGTARIRATLSVTSGYHKGTVLEKYIDITVAGATEGTFTLTQPETAVVLKNQTGNNTYDVSQLVSAVKGSGDTSDPVRSYSITSGETYASVNATSGLVTATSNDGGTVTVKITATFTRRTELGGGTYTKEGDVTVYVAPTVLHASKSSYDVTAGESVAFTKPYVVIDGKETTVTSVTYSATTDLGAINGEQFVSVVGAGGTVSGGVSVTASLTAGVFSAENLTLTGGYTLKVLGIAASATVPTVTADGNALELTASHVNLGEGVTATSVIALETDNADLSINSDYKWKLLVDLGTHRYFGDTAPANIPVKVKVQATGASGTYVGYITVEIVPRKVKTTAEGYAAAKTLKVGESFTVTYTIDGEFTSPSDLDKITDVRMEANSGTCSAVKKNENNATRLVYTYTARTATSGGSTDKATMKVEICGHVYTLGEIDVTVSPAPVVPTFTPNGSLSGDVYTFNHTVTNGKEGATPTYKYNVLSGSEAIVGGTIAGNATGFTVKHLKSDVDIVIEVTATITATDGGTHTITERLEAIHVDAAPAPTFTSTATQDSTNDKLYTIANTVTNSTGTTTYTYRIISGEDAVVGKSIANNATSFTVQECDEVTTLVIEVTASIPTSYGTETMKYVLDPITVHAKASSTVLTSTLTNTDNAYTITNTLSKSSYTATYEYSVTSGNEAIDGSITKGTGDNANKATFNVKNLDRDVYVVIEITATVRINGFRTETHKATVTTLVPADPPVFTSDLFKDATETDKYNIANNVEKAPSGAVITYSYKVLSGSNAIDTTDGMIADDATSFTVKHLAYDVDIVIEVTATVKENADATEALYTFTKVLDPVRVDALVIPPEPEFTSSEIKPDGSAANKYNITNTVSYVPSGAVVEYSYKVLSSSATAAIVGYTDEADNGIKKGTGENAHTATFNVQHLPYAVDIVIEVTVTIKEDKTDGKVLYTFTKVLKPVHVDALEPEPSFTSTFAAGEGTDANKYTITNNLANAPAGAITYTYTVIAGSEAILGYTDATSNGITKGTGENEHKATFTANPQSTDTAIYIKVTATVTPTADGDAQTFTQYLEITVPATTPEP